MWSKVSGADPAKLAARKESASRLKDEEVDALTVISTCALGPPRAPALRWLLVNFRGHCTVTVAEIKRLWQIFNELDLNESGSVSRDEILKLPQLAFNSLG